jgi:hypothetical protein
MLDFTRFKIAMESSDALALLRQLKGLAFDPRAGSRQSTELWRLLGLAKPHITQWVLEDLWKAAGQAEPGYRGRWLTAMTMVLEGLLARHGLIAVGDVERIMAAARARGGMEPEQAAELVRMLRAILDDKTPGSKLSPDLWELLDAARPHVYHYADDVWHFAALEDWNHRRRALRPQVEAIEGRLNYVGLVLGRGG